MPIVRPAERRHPYVRIDHRALENERLSWAARGVLAYLLVKPDDWSLRIEDLRARGNLGRDGLYGVLTELERYGYLKRESQRDSRGRLGKVVYVIFEVPFAELSDPAQPEPVEPDRGDPLPAKPMLLTNQLYTNESVKKQTTTTTRDSTGDEEGARTGGEELEFPKSLTDSEVAAAKRKLEGLPSTLSQPLLDELAGRMQANAIRGSPLAYLRGLIERAKAGDFTPEAGLPLAATRWRRQTAARALERADASAPSLPPPNEDNPLVQRLNRARRRRQLIQGADELGESMGRDDR